jgi:hypothetical protein
MRTLFLLWGTLMLINFLLMLAKMFSIKNNVIKFSWVSKSFLVSGVLLMTSIFTFNGTENVFELPKSTIVLIIILSLTFLYSIYAVFFFRYGYTNDYFFWFNGIKIKRVSASKIREIQFIVRGSGILRFKFVTQNGTEKIENSIGIENFIEQFAETNGIEVKYFDQ